MKILFYNPENDLALYNGDSNYVAPASAQKLAEDLSEIISVIMDKDDYLWIEDSCTIKPLSECYLHKLLNGDFLRKIGIGQEQRVLNNGKDIRMNHIDSIMPWGWSDQIFKRFKKDSLLMSYLPDQRFIDNIKIFSNRIMTIEFFNRLLENEKISGFMPDIPVIIDCEEQLFSKLSEDNGYILKSPLSGSGKGLCWCNKLPHLSIKRWFNTTVKKAGFVLCEKILCKELDFAMEFYISCDEVVFCGYSLFKTDDSGVYRSSFLMADTDIEFEISKHTGENMLFLYKEAVMTVVRSMYLGKYEGYIGIDMLVYKDKGDNYKINPCIEVNLRMTMGLIARKFYDKYVKTGKGIMDVVYLKKEEDLFIYDMKMKEKYPLSTINNMVEYGYLTLTEVNKSTNYSVTAVVNV